MDQLLRRLAFAQQFDEPLHVLSTILGADQGRVSRVHDDHIGEPDRCQQPLLPVENRALAAEI